MVGQYEKLPERILMDLEAIADEPGMEMLKLIFIFSADDGEVQNVFIITVR